MAELVIVSFADRERARALYEQLQLLQEHVVLEIAGVALVDVDADGHLHVDSPGRSERRGVRAASTAVFGTVLGALFLMPFAGLALGGAVGALVAGLDRASIDGPFRERVADEVTAGRSAVVVYATSVRDGRLQHALAPDDATVLRTVLSPAAEREIVDQITRWG